MNAPGTVVLDAWPVVEAANGSRHAISEIGSLISTQTPLMSAVNYAEVYSAVLIVQGVMEARDTIGLLRQVVELELPDYKRILQAAHLKSSYYLALGDGFAAATALHHGAELWTGDAELLFEGSPWRARDLRPVAADGSAPAVTRKERDGKIGRRARAYGRPANEPEIAPTDLMRFLAEPLTTVDTRPD